MILSINSWIEERDVLMENKKKVARSLITGLGGVKIVESLMVSPNDRHRVSYGHF